MAASASVPSRFSAPNAYTPRHLAERILASSAAMGGERKQVTVLFADLKSSMELLADRDPEEARGLLGPVVERMIEAVHRYEGTVNQVMGDGIMALFGAPLAHEDHAVRACYAALRMQETVRRHAEEVRRTHGVPIHIRVGLNSGEVVVGTIGSDLRMEYTAVGQTVHLAARMEQLAMPGSILIPLKTLRLVEGFVQVKPVGPVNIKGLSEMVDVYEVVGIGVRTRLQASARRGLTRFIGRDQELEVMRHALERARERRGQVVAIVGEPGVGKSRLFWEFVRSHWTQDWLVLESRSVSYGKATPYLAITDLLKTYFKITDRDDRREVREKVTGKVLALDEGLKPALSPLLALLDATVEDPLWERLEPSERRQRTLEAVKRLLLTESQVQPLLLVFEDLHWVDSETQALLDMLVEGLPIRRILLLVNYRPEYQHDWAGKTYYTQLRIDPLPPERAEELLHALLGHDPTLYSLKRLLVERTEGNPFFLEESVRTLVETNVVIGQAGVYRLATPLSTVQVPATVHAVVAARIDRLGPKEKHLLQSAAVIGKDVPMPLLQAIADFREEELAQALSHLHDAEFLYEVNLFPESEYTFKHALTHEVAYQSLLHGRRQSLHVRILEAMERLYAGRLDEQVERLAHHAFRGEVWGKAMAYLWQAGLKAAVRSANREAMTALEHALGVLVHLPETAENLVAAIDIRVELRNVLYAMGELDRIHRYLQEAEALAVRLGDQRRLGAISVAMTQYYIGTGQMDESRRAGERARDLGERIDDLAVKVGANIYLAYADVYQGYYREAQAVFRTIIGWLEADLAKQRYGLTAFPAVLARVWLSELLAERGEFEEATVHAKEAMHIAEEIDHTYSRVVGMWAFGHVLTLRGSFGEAALLLERALELAREHQIGYLQPMVMCLLGPSYAFMGRIAESLALLPEGLAMVESMRSYVDLPIFLLSAGQVSLLGGRPQDAASFAQRALEMARERRSPRYEAYALRLIGGASAGRQPPDVQEAEARYKAALDLAENLGIRPLAAHCHLDLGKLYRLAGERHRGEEQLNRAADLYRMMGMRFWLEQAEAELAVTMGKT